MNSPLLFPFSVFTDFQQGGPVASIYKRAKPVRAPTSPLTTIKRRKILQLGELR